VVQGVDGGLIAEVSAQVIKSLNSLKSINDFAKGVHLSVIKIIFELVVNGFGGVTGLGSCNVDMFDEFTTEFEHDASYE
jgi:hypothetical protein